MPSSTRKIPPLWISFVPPAAAAVLLILRGGGHLVAWILLFAAVVVAAILEACVGLVRSSGARQPELQPVTEANVVLARSASLAVTFLESMIAVNIGISRLDFLPSTIAVGLLFMVAALAYGVRRISAALAEVRTAGHGELVKGYGAMLYRNKDDPRVWVPKLGGVGHTLNFAHASSWWVIVLLLAFPVLIIVTAVLTAPRR